MDMRRHRSGLDLDILDLRCGGSRHSTVLSAAFLDQAIALTVVPR
jgi:hypothetical protein